MRVRFGDCLFDSEARMLTRAGRTVELSPKADGLLTRLLETRPKAVSQQELRDLLWPDVHVGYTSLARVVAEARRAIGDSRAESRFIRTIHGFGYAFSGEAMEDGAATAPIRPASSYRLLAEDQEVRLREGENLIGRSVDCLIRIDSAFVSRRHARILVEGARATIEDLGSKNGTRLRGRRIETPTALSDADEIRVGPKVMVFRWSDLEDSTRTQ